MTESAAKRGILLASAAAFLVAVILLVTVLLPAEYGWDPLGTGAALGLLGMAVDDVAVLDEQDSPWRQDAIALQLAPFESVEYKYRLQQGEALLFQWRADGEVLFDLHAEPDGAAQGYAESFATGRGSGANGSYTAPFPGLHGWFWQNRGDKTVIVTLQTSGYFDRAVEFRDGRAFTYEVEGAR
ncbi:MAG: hypothetical protein HRT77_09430 [Halioglobus sp.]|nr:hypothetical protein [Halioglobus sp.]